MPDHLLDGTKAIRRTPRQHFGYRKRLWETDRGDCTVRYLQFPQLHLPQFLRPERANYAKPMATPWVWIGGMDAGNAMGLQGDVVHERTVVWCRAAGPTSGFKKTLGRAPTKININVPNHMLSAGRGSITEK